MADFRGRRKDEGGRRYASRIVKQEAGGKKQEARSKRYASSTSGLIMNTVYDAYISVLFSFLPPPSSLLDNKIK
jgi:hypothetical protein